MGCKKKTVLDKLCFHFCFSSCIDDSEKAQEAMYLKTDYDLPRQVN